MNSPLIHGLAGAFAWWLFVAYSIHHAVVSFAWGYNEPETYLGRLAYTLTSRIDLLRTFLYNFAISLVIFVIVYFFNLGVLQVL